MVFNWKIVSMPAYSYIDGESDVVFEVNWACFAKDMGYSASSAGTVPVSYKSGEAFTPYEQLTEEQVWGWINPSIDRAEIEANLQRMIEEQKTPVVVTPALPWEKSEAN